MSRTRVMTIVGTRPEIIRLSAVIRKLDDHVDHVLVHTGQNYDHQLSEVFFRDLDLRSPDHFMDIETSSLGAAIGDIMRRTEEIVLAERPDALLVLGDTNSALSAVIAKRMKVPIYHMEAGNRCFDANVPEEVNRRIVDHVADFNLVYTEHARRHLLSEGIPHRRIYLTGSPMNEVLSLYRSEIMNSTILEDLGLERGGYFLVSAHREENVDDRESLRSVINIIEQLQSAYKKPVIITTHPRTRSRMDAAGTQVLSPEIRFCEPFGFLDYNKLQAEAFCVVSDSGTISEESAILGFPALTIRNAMERPEALDAGTVVITGLRPETVLEAVSLVTRQRSSAPQLPAEYQIGDTSERVLRLIVGTCRLARRWQGMDDFSRYDWERGAS